MQQYTTKIVCKHYGEQSITEKSPYKPIEEFTEDMNEKKNCILDSDDYRLVEVNLFEVKEFILPICVKHQQICEGGVTLRHFLHYLSPFNYNTKTKESKRDYSVLEQITEVEFWNLYKIYCKYDKQFEITLKLLKTVNFKSEFRRSLFQQIKSWLNELEHKYDSPLSSKQWGCLNY